MVGVYILDYLLDFLPTLRATPVRRSAEPWFVDHHSILATVRTDRSETSLALVLLAEDAELFAAHLTVLLGPSLDVCVVFFEEGD